MADGGTELDGLTWEAPGPGLWGRDAGHFPGPVTTLFAELFSPAFATGTARSLARYGSPSHHAEYLFVNRHGFGTSVPIDEDEVEARIALAEAAFAECRWNDDVARWHQQVKPAAIRAHLALQRVDVDALDDEAAADHLVRCIDHYRAMVEQHHELNTSATFPLADFLARAAAWTGRSASEILPLLRGASPVSRGGGPELADAAAAVRDDASATRALARGASVEELRTLSGVGPAVDAYIARVGHRLITGFDFVNPTGVELPDLLRRALAEAVATGSRTSAGADAAAQLRSEFRAAVPAGSRAEFDEGLATARRTWLLRDERGVYSDAWAAGILRLAFLAVGRRLAKRGAVEDADHLFEARPAEVRSLVTGGTDRPGAVALAERVAERAALAHVRVPETLGVETPAPAFAARWPRRYLDTRAMAGMLTTDVDPPAPGPPSSVRGLAANPGSCDGRARVVAEPHDLAFVEPGEILVMPTTSEAICVVVPLLAAVVTDHGGLLTHAAIVAREVGIPAVVGCGNATTAIRSGDLVRVDGTAGEVTILERAGT